MCKMIISPGVFLIYLKFWFFGQLGVKRAKNSPRWQKKFCFLHFISQEPDIIWLSFMVHNIFNSIRKNICACMFSVHNTINLSCHEQVPDKLIVLSPRGFFIFSKSWASGFARGKGAKNGTKWQKIISHFVYQELHLIRLSFLVHMCKMMLSTAIFFRFFKILIFRVFQISSTKAKRIFWSVPHVLHMSVIFN